MKIDRPLNFDNWMMTAYPTPPNPDRLERRWRGVAAYAETISSGGLLDMVRLTLSLERRAATVQGGLLVALNQADPTFHIEGHDEELRLLAGSLIASALDNAPPSVPLDTACIALLTGSFALNEELGQAPYSPFVFRAHEYMRRRANQTHGFGDLPWDDEDPSEPEGGVGDATIVEIVDGPDRVGTSVPMHAFVRLSRAVAILGEELDFAWWLIGEFSRDEAIPLRELNSAALPAFVGKELADLTRSPVGPISVGAVAHRAVRTSGAVTSDEISGKEIVESLSSDWVAKWIGVPAHKGSALDDLTPIAHALSDTARVADVLAKRTATSEAWAVQFYWESLLMRNLRADVNAEQSHP